eukprot:5717384-Ditylum_brightwellii.AAC.1
MVILVMGLHKISELVMIPGTTTLLSFHQWLLSVKTSDKSTCLFSAVEKDPNNEVEAWIDYLPEKLVTRFLVDNVDSVTTDTNPTHSYQVILSDNTDDAVSAYNLIL